MDKRGLSKVIVTLILIAISLITVGLVWEVARQIILEGTEEISLTGFKINIEILKVEIDGNNINVNTKRNTGQGNLTRIKFIFSDEENTESKEITVSLKELESETFDFTLDDLNISEVKSVSIAPIYVLNSGKEVLGNIDDTYNIVESGSGGGNDVSEPKNVNLGTIPNSAAIIFWSIRDVSNGNIMSPSNLYVMDEDGNNVVQITFEGYNYEHAVVSPDRKKIVAARKDPSSENTQVILSNLEDKTEINLVPQFIEAGNGGVDWSIDNWIYFRAKTSGEFGDNEVYRVRPDGSSIEQITNNPKMDVFDVSVSEDGTMVTHVGIVPFKNSQGEVCGKPQIWVVNVDGSNHRMVDDGGDECGISPDGYFPLGDYDPEISPDNKYVVFSRTNEIVTPNFQSSLNTAHDLWIARIDQSEPVYRVTQQGPIAIIPDWYKGEILYTEYNENDNYVGLVTIKPDGTGRVRLEDHPTDIWDGGRHGKWISTVS